MNNILVYVINLETSIDRKEYIRKLCHQHNLQPTFIDAVCGKNLSEKQIQSVCCQKKALHCIGRELMQGEIGCALSHKKIYQRMVDENIEIALILEDDAWFDGNLNKILSLIDNFPKSWELLLLGHQAGQLESGELASPISVWDKHKLTEEYTIGRLAGLGFGTYGYLVNQKGTKKLFNELKLIYQPIDHYTSDSSLVNVYAISPTVIKVQQEFETLIDESLVRENKKSSLLKKIIKKIGFFQIIKKVYFFIKILLPVREYK